MNFEKEMLNSLYKVLSIFLIGFLCSLLETIKKKKKSIFPMAEKEPVVHASDCLWFTWKFQDHGDFLALRKKNKIFEFKISV